MQINALRKILYFLGLLLALWLGIRYLLPLLLPFLLGIAIALTAEPAVKFISKKLRLPRPAAAGLGVSTTLILLVGTVGLVGALAVRELGSLAHRLPDVEATVDQGMDLLRSWAVQLADGLPVQARTMAEAAAEQMFDSKNVLQGQLTARASAVLKGFLSRLPGGALTAGTGVLSAFMFSARLPKLRQGIAHRLPPAWQERYKPALKRMGQNVILWLKAQCKLSAVTYGIVTVGFLLMGISYGPFWAALVALVDAVPVLGTGTVLLPWALVSLIQGNSLRAVGLLMTYAGALLTRTVLEPRLVGKHLGLDPLVTLLCLYAGYRLWGIAGMILAPMLTAASKGIFDNGQLTVDS